MENNYKSTVESKVTIMCNTISELLSLQMPVASQKKVLSSFYLVSIALSKDPACSLYACANQRQTNLTKYWWQPQSVYSNLHIPSMARFSPQQPASHPDLTGCRHVSSPRVSLGTSPFVIGAKNLYVSSTT